PQTAVPCAHVRPARLKPPSEFARCPCLPCKNARMQWDDLRYLLAIHRHHSHARAARILGVAATTVGRRIAALEADAGTRRVRRPPDGHVLTTAARALLPSLERIETEVGVAERLAQGGGREVAGTVRLTAGDGIMNYRLIPALSILHERHPELVI